MSDPVAFLLAALVLLATPGPTNILLAVSGAGAGFRAAPLLLAAALAGYMITTLTLGLALGPLVGGAPLAEAAMRGLAALYLVWLGLKLWREGAIPPVLPGSVAARRIFFATLLNPKALIFAFVILPYLKAGRLAAALPYLAALAGLIIAVGAVWIALGRALRMGGGMTESLARRAGAVALAVFAVVLAISAWSLAAG